MKARRRVVFGFLGNQRDAGFNEKRHTRWRPTIGLMADPEAALDHIVLFAADRDASLASIVKKDIEALGRTAQLVPFNLSDREIFDFEIVYATMLDFFKTYPFDHQRERYFVHISTGSHVVQICLFLMVEAGFVQGSLIQTVPGPKGKEVHGRTYEIDLDLSKYSSIMARYEAFALQNASVLKAGIETKNRLFNELIAEVEAVAASPATILLTGPTGAGKSQLASKIFELKKAAALISGSFVELNCATLRGDTALSALFGHVRGAFTGAQEARTGALLSANHGVLFLDEVGELSLDVQAALLRALEDKTFRPVGSDKILKSEFQLITGTNRDLRAMVAAGSFREDLLARINIWNFKLPSLRERSEDIEPNIHYELARAEQRLGRKLIFEPRAFQRYLSFATSPLAIWSGNFRDLSASMLRLSTLAAASGHITNSQVEREITRLLDSWGSLVPPATKPAVIDSTPRDEESELGHALRLVKLYGSINAAAKHIDRYKNLKNPADGLRKFLKRHDALPAREGAR